MATFSETRTIWWKRIKMIMLLLVLCTLAFLVFAIFGNYSSGTRTGYVTKISHKGYVFKTYEGEMNTGFFSSNAINGPQTGNVWHFSVNNKATFDEVQRASESGKKVTLFYKEKFIQISLRGDTKYMVHKVEYVE